LRFDFSLAAAGGGVNGKAQTKTKGGDYIDKPIEPKMERFDPDPGAAVDMGPWKYSCPARYELRDDQGTKYGAWATGDADIFGLLKCYPIHGSD